MTLNEINHLAMVTAIIDETHLAVNWRGQIYECRALRGTGGLAIGHIVALRVLADSGELVLDESIEDETAGYYYVNFVIDGGGDVIEPGYKGHLQVPAGTIVQWAIAADQSGNIAVDVWKGVTAGLPLTADDSITGGSPPTLSDAVQTQSLPSGWTTAIAEGDWLGFNVESDATVALVTVSLKVLRGT